MPDITIPDAAVEAAAMIIGGWDGRGEPFRHEMWRQDARHVLTAAAPHIIEVTEAAVREQVARDIEAVRGEHLRWYGNQTLSLAARIARGAS